ncbi:MAG: macro domain-containing protein [Lachnospiraceae bacterium]|nr:macro domain-containing protein [Lachnospiraceae bacterium]
MPFKIVRNDITRMEVDVIVNTANRRPIYSTGTDLAVYKAAGELELLEERKKIGYLESGEVAITPGFKLPAKYIIHAASPIYIDGNSGEEERLRSCYKKSLELAYENKCNSIAFPLISTGNFGYPKEEGIRIAVDEINGFLIKHEMLIYLVVFDTESTRLGLNIYPDIEAYIDHNYVCDKREEEYNDRYFGSVRKDDPGYDAYRIERNNVEDKLKKTKPKRFSSLSKLTGKTVGKTYFNIARERLSDISLTERDKGFDEETISLCREDSCIDYGDKEKNSCEETSYEEFITQNETALQERMKHLSDTFQEYLLYLIELRGLTNSEVYKRAIITKQLFSKIKLNPNYHPDKGTAMRLCIGAKLNLDETKDLLARAGYALSPCDKRDIIFSYFIENKIYDMIEIDIVLEEYDLPCFIE